MNQNERLLTEAIQTYLQHKIQLGIPDPPKDLADADSKSFQHLHEQINDMFEMKTVDLTHHEGICSAFRKVHSYKYVTDPHFYQAMQQEMAAQGIPLSEQQKAAKTVTKVVEEISKEESGNWAEQDAGFHPDLDEIIKVSKPGQEDN
jgi:hypothetical protein